MVKKSREGGVKILLFFLPFLLLGLLVSSLSSQATAPEDEAKQSSLKDFEEKDVVPPSGEAPLTLEECIKRALEHDTRIQAKEKAIEAVKWQEEEAHARYWPILEYENISAPVPKDVSRALDSLFSGEVALFNRFKVGLGVPLYAFGQLALVEKLAGKGVEGGLQEKLSEEAKTIFDVKQVYYGIQLAYELDRLLGKALEEVRETIEEDIEDPEHSPVDILKLKRFVLELEKGIADVDQKGEMAKEGLRALIGFNPAQGIVISKPGLDPEPLTFLPFEDYVAQAFQERPEVKLLEIGSSAKELQYQLEKRKILPRLGVGGTFEMGRTTQQIRGLTTTDDFTNPFHFTRAGVGFELKGRFDFHGVNARIKKAQAEHHKMLLEKFAAKEGIRLEVKEAYLRALGLSENVTRAEEMQKLARRMLFLTKSNTVLGIGEEREYVEALQLLLTSRADYFKTVYDFNVAAAKLEQKIGAKP